MKYGAHSPEGSAMGEEGWRRGGDWLGWAKAPGVNPAKVLAVVAGFAICPPVGVAVLGGLVWMNYRGGHGCGGGGGRKWGRCGMGRRGWSGNSALDERQARQMEEMEAERRAFMEWRMERHRQRDVEAWEAFQAERAMKAAARPDADKTA